MRPASIAPVRVGREALPQRLHGRHRLAHGAQRSLQRRAALACALRA